MLDEMRRLVSKDAAALVEAGSLIEGKRHPMAWKAMGAALLLAFSDAAAPEPDESERVLHDAHP